MPKRTPLEMLEAAEVEAHSIFSGLITRARYRGEFDGDMRKLYHALRDLADRSRQFTTGRNKLANLRDTLRAAKEKGEV